MNYSSVICDYITLFFEDGNISNGVGEWEIPSSSYYYQTRGAICCVSLADCVFQLPTATDNVLIGIDAGFNSSVAQEKSSNKMNNNLAFLGSVNLTSQQNLLGAIFEYQKTDNIKILTPARPSKIKLYFFKAKDKASFDISKGCVTLKYEYLSVESERQINEAVSYIPFTEQENI